MLSLKESSALIKKELSSGSLDFEIKGVHYKYIRVLGAGAFGKALLYQTSDGNLMTVKFMFPYAEAGVYDTFRMEVDNMMMVRNALNNVCMETVLCFIDVIQLDNPNDAFYKAVYQNLQSSARRPLSPPGVSLYAIITKYAGGNELADFIEENAKLNKMVPHIILTAFVDQMLETLKIIHDKHIAHRDIKPANIIFDKEKGYFVLIDFGLACSNCARESFGGTPGFIPLESLILLNERKPVTLQNYQVNDLFALGVTLYLLAHNGRNPFSRFQGLVYDESSYINPATGYPDINEFAKYLILTHGITIDDAMRKWRQLERSTMSVSSWGSIAPMSGVEPSWGSVAPMSGVKPTSWTDISQPVSESWVGAGSWLAPQQITYQPERSSRTYFVERF